jgi:hypothetical protein
MQLYWRVLSLPVDRPRCEPAGWVEATLADNGVSGQGQDRVLGIIIQLLEAGRYPDSVVGIGQQEQPSRLVEDPSQRTDALGQAYSSQFDIGALNMNGGAELAQGGVARLADTARYIAASLLRQGLATVIAGIEQSVFAASVPASPVPRPEAKSRV